MTSLSVTETHADRAAERAANGLLAMIDMAISHPHPGIRNHAQGQLSHYARKAHEAAEDVMRQRQYEAGFDSLSRALFPSVEPERNYTPGPGHWEGS